MIIYILFSIIILSGVLLPKTSFVSYAASQPYINFFEDPEYKELTLLYKFGKSSDNYFYMEWRPAYNYEGYVFSVYNSDDELVAQASRRFTNLSTSKLHFDIKWDTSNCPAGRYKVVVTKEFYSLNRWNETALPSTIYAVVSDTPTDEENEQTQEETKQEKVYISDDEGADVPEGYAMMFRLYNPNSGEHFYTSSKKEGNKLVDVGWTYEGKAWTAPTSGDPVYRLYNGNTGDHHYTMSKKERDNLIRVGWKDEGIGWYSLPKGTGTPLYRLYNPNCTGAGSHHYTSSNRERESLVKQGWNDEGIAWYGL